MIQRAYPLILVAALGLAGCGQSGTTTNVADTPTNTVAAIERADNIEIPAGEGGATVATDDASPARDLTGRWTGVEGMFLDVAAGSAPGEYRLTMQWDLDHKGSFAGHAAGDGIAFERGGETLMLRPTVGDATGLKYLAGKDDCLTVTSGEGYCRDR